MPDGCGTLTSRRDHGEPAGTICKYKTGKLKTGKHKRLAP